MSSTYHDDVFERFVKFCEKYDGDLDSKESEFYRKWYNDMKENCKLSEGNVIRMLKIFPDFQLPQGSNTNKTFVKFIEFVETNNRLPKCSDSSMYSYYLRIRKEREKLNVLNREKFEELLVLYGISGTKQLRRNGTECNNSKFFEHNHSKFLKFIEFVETNKRLPKKNSQTQYESSLRNWYHNVIRLRNLPDEDLNTLSDIYEKYRELHYSRRTGRIAK